MTRRCTAAAAALVALALAPPVAAHEREYTLSRDWFLPYDGEHELESRTFWDTRNGNVTQEIEYEYGVTDWFAVEPGVEFHHTDEKDLELEALELELRFHFLDFEYGKPLPALNLKYEHPTEEEDGEDDSAELIGIVSWYGEDGQDYNLNLDVGRSLQSGGEDISELTFGYIRPLHPKAAPEHAGWHVQPRFGLEGVYDIEHEHAGLGPLLKYRGSSHLNLLGAYIFGLDHREVNHDELRVILEWEF